MKKIPLIIALIILFSYISIFLSANIFSYESNLMEFIQEKISHLVFIVLFANTIIKYIKSKNFDVLFLGLTLSLMFSDFSGIIFLMINISAYSIFIQIYIFSIPFIIGFILLNLINISDSDYEIKERIVKI